MRIKAYSVVAVICGALVLAGVAWAKGWVTRVTIHQGTKMSLHGRVYSSSPKCRAGRTIEVFRETGHVQNPRKDKLVGKTTSKPFNQFFAVWSGITAPHPGAYYARATRHVLPSGRVCLAGNSRTIFVTR
jgi:hypothetical protein